MIEPVLLYQGSDGSDTPGANLSPAREERNMNLRTLGIVILLGAIIAGCDNAAPGLAGPEPPNGQAGPDVGSVTLSPSSLTVQAYQTARLTVVVRDRKGAVIPNAPVVFMAQGLADVTVDPSTGLVTVLAGRCGDVGTVVALSGGVYSNTVVVHVGGGESAAGCWGH